MKTLNESQVLQQVSFTGKYFNSKTFTLETEKSDVYSEKVVLINGDEYISLKGSFTSTGATSYFKKLADVIKEKEGTELNFFAKAEYEIKVIDLRKVNCY